MQTDVTQTLPTGGHDALHLVALLMYMASFMSMALAVAPVLWGQVKVKWLITGITMSTMLGCTAMVAHSLAGPVPPDAAPPPTAPPHEIDWTATGLLLLAVLALAAIAVGTRRAIPTIRRLRARRAERIRARSMLAEERARARMLATDPAHVALTFAPDMAEDVNEALERIARLRSIGDHASRAEDADAMTMVERRMPSVMRLYARTAEVCTPDERAAAARTALGSVIDIGRMAEDARQRMAGDLRSDLDTESRYISSRSGHVPGLGID